MITKGIILAGGKGTRLYPMTHVFSKQLQTVYDKPMIYYPIALLMLAGIKNILIITTPEDIDSFKKLLGDGKQWGIELSYIVQPKPGGLPQAFILGEEFIGNNQVCLVLGDNLFYGKLDFIRRAIKNNTGGTIFAYQVEEPQNYGVVEFDKSYNVLSIEEKPENPKSKYAIPGLYVFDSSVVAYAKELVPSARGELEIVDLHKRYLEEKKLDVQMIGRGIAWLDTGTPETLIEAGIFIHSIEKRQGRKIACLEEISLHTDFVDLDQYKENVAKLPNCEYKDYCLKVMEEYE